MRKDILFTTCFIALNVAVFPVIVGQDLITTIKGETIKSKVLEIGTSEIKYKKFENLDGPIYSVLKSDMVMIYYANGTTELYVNNTDKPTNEMPNNPEKSSTGSALHADKAFLSFSYGLSVPVGKFASTVYNLAGAGYAEPGFASEISVNRRLGKRSFRSIVSLYSANFLTDAYALSQSSGSDVDWGIYSIGGLSAGFQYAGRITPSQFLTTRIMLGLHGCTKPEMTMNIGSGWIKEGSTSSFVVPLILGIGHQYNFGKNLKLISSFDFLRAYPMFNNIEITSNFGSRSYESWSQPISSFNVTLGIGVCIL